MRINLHKSNLICIFAPDFKLKSVFMIEKTHVVSVNFGLHTNAQFDASFLQGEDAQHFSYFRVSSDGRPVESIGLVTVDLEKQRIGFLYDIFEVMGDLQDMKKVGDNYHFKCVTDFSRIDVYVCDPDEWTAKGESIFYS